MDAPLDLRARRHAATHQDIHRAALDLFERQGVRATTVHQIAELAGVSTRTFFRHFTSKEQAALPGQRRLEAAIDDLRAPADTSLAALLSAVEDAAAEAMTAPDDEAQRIARLLPAEPDLQALALAQEQLLAARLRDRLHDLRPDLDPGLLLLLAQIVTTTWQTAWTRWAENRDTDPVDTYRRTVADLRTILL